LFSVEKMKNKKVRAVGGGFNAIRQFFFFVFLTV
jgi:hypothetical protein